MIPAVVDRQHAGRVGRIAQGSVEVDHRSSGAGRRQGSARLGGDRTRRCTAARLILGDHLPRELLSNQTLVLGGLIENRRTFNRTGIPGLSRIPVLGLLFGSREEKIEKTELVLMITPRVVGTAVDAARLTEEMRRITPDIEQSIKRAPRPPTPQPPDTRPPTERREGP